jgi:hypothetical protein
VAVDVVVRAVFAPLHGGPGRRRDVGL